MKISRILKTIFLVDFGLFFYFLFFLQSFLRALQPKELSAHSGPDMHVHASTDGQVPLQRLINT